MKHPPRKIILSLLALIAIAAGGYAILRGGSNGSPEERYQFQSVEKGDLTQSVAANGTLNPVTVVNVGTQVSGTVRKLYVDFNSKVTKGQVLLELDNSLFVAQTKQGEANVTKAKADLDLAKANEARARSLFSQDYISRQEFDQAIQAKKTAQAQLDLARAQLEKDRANLNYSVIRSPVSGIVIDRSVDVGQTVAASFQTPTLVKIAEDLSKMQIDSSFAEADIGRIRVGQVAHFNVDAFPDRRFEGVVRLIRLNPTTQQNVVTYNVVIAVDNKEQLLLPGMTAYVNLAIAERQDVLMVPNVALRFSPTDAAKGEKKGDPGHKRSAMSGTVYVLREKTLTPVSVGLGITDNRNTEVVSDELKPGDRIATGDKGGKTKPESPGGVRFRMF